MDWNPYSSKMATLCWRCKNAVPSKTTGCSWSRNFKPVPNWIVDAHELTLKNGDKIRSYCVLDCPEFQDDHNEPENKLEALW